jgi:hypothetical protein
VVTRFCFWVGCWVNSRKPNTSLPKFEEFSDKVIEVDIFFGIKVKSELLIITNGRLV